MCEMLLRQGIDAFEMAWTDVMLANLGPIRREPGELPERGVGRIS
jgi:hypothetical protein